MDSLNVYVQSIIVFVTQFALMYLRVLNVNANISKDRLKLMWTGILLHIAFLISTSISISAVLNGNILLITVSIISSVIGGGI